MFYSTYAVPAAKDTPAPGQSISSMIAAMWKQDVAAGKVVPPNQEQGEDAPASRVHVPTPQSEVQVSDMRAWHYPVQLQKSIYYKSTSVAPTSASSTRC